METLSRADVESLMAGENEPHVSIFMPTHTVVNTRQDTTRLRKLLEQAEVRLVDSGLRPVVVREMLEPARNLLESGLFPQAKQHSEGLALFIARNFFRHYHVPIPLEEQVVMGDKFTIEPLLPLLDESENGSYYVLALSLNSVRLFRATRHSVRPVELPGKVPITLAEAMRYDDFEMEHQYYSGTPGSAGGYATAGGKGGAIFYGQGVESDIRKENILRYFQQIDRGLHPLLRTERQPMVLAAVEYLQPIYRQANTYAYLLLHGIAGNPNEKRAEELRDEAWPVVAPLFAKDRREALDRYRHLAGTGRTCADISTIVPAAFQGQVDTLFIARSQHETAGPPAAGEPGELAEVVDRELVNLAAVYALLNRGTLYVVEPDLMPQSTPIAATLRY